MFFFENLKLNSEYPTMQSNGWLSFHINVIYSISLQTRKTIIHFSPLVKSKPCENKSSESRQFVHLHFLHMGMLFWCWITENPKHITLCVLLLIAEIRMKQFPPVCVAGNSKSKINSFLCEFWLRKTEHVQCHHHLLLTHYKQMMLMCPSKCMHVCTQFHYVSISNWSFVISIKLSSLPVLKWWNIDGLNDTVSPVLMVSHRQSTSRAQKKKLKGAKPVEVLCSLLYGGFSVVEVLFVSLYWLATFDQHKALWVLFFSVCTLFSRSRYAKFRINLPLCLLSVFHSSSHTFILWFSLSPSLPLFSATRSRAYPPPLLHPPKNGTAIVNVKSIDYRKIALHVLLCCRTLWKFLYTCHFSQL